MKIRILIAVALISILALIIYSMSSGSSDEAYISALKQERLEKDQFMKDSEQSPFGNNRDSFTGLKYFDPNIKYRVYASLEPIKNKKIVVVPTSTGEQNRYLEYAWAVFTLEGKENRLVLLEVMDMGPTRGTLFLAFADETSARETYGAGRYLELKKVAAATSIELDFNRAYNPYCAYVDGYSCPLPPPENRLTIAILAGEKNYDDTTP